MRNNRSCVFTQGWDRVNDQPSGLREHKTLITMWLETMRQFRRKIIASQCRKGKCAQDQLDNSPPLSFSVSIDNELSIARGTGDVPTRYNVDESNLSSERRDHR